MPKGTLEILEDYKTFQERERDAIKSMYSSGYGYYTDIDHIYDTMGLDYSAQDCPYPEWDQMRQSFSKYVTKKYFWYIFFYIIELLNREMSLRGTDRIVQH